MLAAGLIGVDFKGHIGQPTLSCYRGLSLDAIHLAEGYMSPNTPHTSAESIVLFFCNNLLGALLGTRPTGLGHSPCAEVDIQEERVSLSCKFLQGFFKVEIA